MDDLLTILGVVLIAAIAMNVLSAVWQARRRRQARAASAFAAASTLKRTITYGYRCGGCGVRDRLSVILHAHVRGAPHTNSSRPCVYTTAALYECHACGMLQLEHFDHDCYPHYEDEPWDQCFRARIDPHDAPALRAFVARCRSPLDEYCGCEAHAFLRSEHGRETASIGADSVHIERLAKYD